MKKAEGEALQRQVNALEHQVRHLSSALSDQKRWNTQTRDWNRKARLLLGLWLKWFFMGHPARPPVGSTRSHLKEW
jgi:hypothetical protein